MAIMKPVTLRGKNVQDYIAVQDNAVRFTPLWGLARNDWNAIMAPVLLKQGIVFTGKLRNPVAVRISNKGTPVIVPLSADKAPTRELVLLQEFSPGVGAKRWPAFYVDFSNDPDVREIAKMRTGGGSGAEKWHLLITPLGWAEDIASRCVEHRDAPDNIFKL